MLSRGEEVTIDFVQEAQRLRDQEDRNRDFGGLRKAPDSVEISTDGMSPSEVVDKLEELVRSRMTIL